MFYIVKLGKRLITLVLNIHIGYFIYSKRNMNLAQNTNNE